MRVERSMVTDQQAGTGADHSPPALPRVTAFVTRERGPERELLIVRPATTKPHLPQMTVGLDEAPSEAAIRLIQELADSLAVTLRRRFGVIGEALQPDTRLLLRPTLLRTAPSEEATIMRFTLERGMRVRLTEMRGDFTRVVYEEYALHENELAIATRRAGWVHAGVLARQVEYHLFHLVVPPPRSDGSTAKLRPPGAPQPMWVPLYRVPTLSRTHAHWLEHIRPFLSE